MIQNFTNNKNTNYSINTRMSVEDKIMEALKNKTKIEQIAILEKISKGIRQRNSIRINKKKYKEQLVDERPDELKLKGEM